MRLQLLVPTQTEGTRRMVLGDTGHLVDPPAALPVRHARALFSAPEPACLQTASLLVSQTGEPLAAPTLIEGLAGPAMGHWQGKTFGELMSLEPEALGAWLADPSMAPPGGESLEHHLTRIGRTVDATSWPEAGAIIVASAFSVRAACLHALGAGSASIAHLDIAPGTVAVLTRHDATWRLRSILAGHTLHKAD